MVLCRMMQQFFVLNTATFYSFLGCIQKQPLGNGARCLHSQTYTYDCCLRSQHISHNAAHKHTRTKQNQPSINHSYHDPKHSLCGFGNYHHQDSDNSRSTCSPACVSPSSSSSGKTRLQSLERKCCYINADTSIDINKEPKTHHHHHHHHVPCL